VVQRNETTNRDPGARGDSARGPVPTTRSWRWLIGVVAVAALVAATVFLPVGAYLEALLAWVQGLGALGPVLLILIYIAACVLFLPGSVLTLAAGYFFGLGIGMVVALIGSWVGSSLAFLLGRTLFRAHMEERLHRSPRFAAIDRAVGREGTRIVLLTRLSPVLPFNLLNFAYGVTAVSFGRYLFGSMVGMLPGTFMYVYFGTAAKSLTEVLTGNAASGPGKTALLIAGLCATVVVTVYVTRLARRSMNEVVEVGGANLGEDREV
jgi:uncharacterized membrane protein YdjX (TVP38/TMEM64 family)